MKKEYKGTGTINEEFVINALQGAMRGLRIGTPTPEEPFPFANPPGHEPGELRGVLHFNAGELNPNVDAREPGEFRVETNLENTEDTIW